MRRTITITTALATIAALALTAGTGAAAKGGNRVTQVACTFELYPQGPPQGTPPSANSFGLVSCPRPLGDGLHYGSASATQTSPGHGTTAVSFKKYFDRGTLRGTVAGAFAATSPLDITYEGTVTVTGGTGRFKHVKGGGKLHCTSSNGGPRKSCQANLKLTGI